MPKKMVLFLIMATILAGFVGGTMGSQLVQAKARPTKFPKAQEYRLTDPRGFAKTSIDLASKGDIYVALYDTHREATESMVVTLKLMAISRKTAATVRKLERVFSEILPGK